MRRTMDPDATSYPLTREKRGINLVEKKFEKRDSLRQHLG